MRKARWTAALTMLALTAGGCVPRLAGPVPLALVQRTPVDGPGGEQLFHLRFHDPEGREVSAFLRRPAAPGTPRAGVVLVAGRETGREAAAVIPGPLEEIVLALEYPADLPETAGAGMLLRELPQMRRTAYRMPGLLRGAARWLAAQDEVDGDRIALVGVSYGVPFAAAAGRDRIFRGVALHHGGAGLATLLRANLPTRNRLLRGLAAAVGARYLRSLEPARHVGEISPTPLLLVNGTRDRLIPRASALRLYEAAREPKRLVWLPHDHLMPGDHALMRELADSTLAHFRFLREPARPGPVDGAALPPDGAGGRFRGSDPTTSGAPRSFAGRMEHPMSTTRTPGAPQGYAPAGKDNGIVKSKGTVNLPRPPGSEPVAHRARKPEWLKVRAPGSPNYLRLKELMRSQGLHTVCEEAHCPNIGECWESGTATFMILGDVCTRACKYCAVAHGLPTELDRDEPRRVADSVVAMGLEHAVITSVNRDELADGGAEIYAECIRQVHARVPGCSVEVLIPDFKGNEDALRTVVEARPEILAHNVDTVERLAKALRPGARYWRSISFLGAVKRMNPAQLTKSAVILGMGETEDEIFQSMRDLREASVDILTLGQYLRPSEHHVPLDRWVTPDEFRRWKEIGERELGFGHVESGPLVRSSYHAKEQARTTLAGGPGRITDIVEADPAGEVRIDPREAMIRAAMAPPPAPRLVQIGSA